MQHCLSASSTQRIRHVSIKKQRSHACCFSRY
jgi:hypothetical protein